MKVAILSETFLPQVNGVVRTVEKIVKFLEANGHEALLVTLGEGDANYSNTEVVRAPGVPFGLYKELHLVKPEDEFFSKFVGNDIMQFPAILLMTLIPSANTVVGEALERFKPDIIHLVTPVTLGAIGHYYMEKMNLPSLATFHTDIAAYAPRYQVPYAENVVNLLTKTIYSKSERVLAPSPSSQKQLEEIGLENVGVFGRGVDHTMYSPEKRNKELLREFNLDTEKITLMYAGRLAEEKSIDKVIDCFKVLQKKYPNKVQLMIVGNGPCREDLEKQLTDTSDYAFTGLQTGDKFASLYAAADIFAFPSVTETFGQVVLESMASALPVVGYDSPGVRDLVENGHSGFLANQKVDHLDESNPASFIAGLINLIEKPELRAELGKNAHAEAQRRSWDNILGDLVREYQVLIDKRKLAAV
ncbi:MAG: glycosyltransferase family 1 protein [Candidatus Caenarcaniphilales bacterium]|nr:glycosyltransferase family 1 protein [Candidatus Caenarcaniphilales bacterium]